MDYARAIRVARALKGHSQKDLAIASTIDQSFISKLEAGKRMPSQTTLKAIADGLQIPRVVLTLLASEADDLQGIPNEKYAMAIGSTLANLLFAYEEEEEPR